MLIIIIIMIIIMIMIMIIAITIIIIHFRWLIMQHKNSSWMSEFTVCNHSPLFDKGKEASSEMCEAGAEQHGILSYLYETGQLQEKPSTGSGCTWTGQQVRLVRKAYASRVSACTPGSTRLIPFSLRHLYRLFLYQVWKGAKNVSQEDLVWFLCRLKLACFPWFQSRLENEIKLSVSF